jgi:putative phosphoesterase
MKKIGLFSDTHSYLDPDILLKYFKNVDEIWHAGDIGNIEQVTDLLKDQGKILRIVWGNIDDKDARLEFKEDCRFTIEGFDIWITHIGGYPGRYTKRVYWELKKNPPDIFICGHSHILKVMRDKQFNNMLTINPGAAGVHGFHKMRTAMRFILDDKKISNMEVVELGLIGKTKV